MQSNRAAKIIAVLLIVQYSFGLQEIDNVSHNENPQLDQKASRYPSKKSSWWQQSKKVWYAASAIVTLAVAGIVLQRNVSKGSPLSTEKKQEQEEKPKLKIFKKQEPVEKKHFPSPVLSGPFYEEVRGSKGKEEESSAAVPKSSYLTKQEFYHLQQMLNNQTTLIGIDKATMKFSKESAQEAQELINERRNKIITNIDIEIARDKGLQGKKIKNVLERIIDVASPDDQRIMRAVGKILNRYFVVQEADNNSEVTKALTGILIEAGDEASAKLKDMLIANGAIQPKSNVEQFEPLTERFGD